jgi:hypothetical protein
VTFFSWSLPAASLTCSVKSATSCSIEAPRCSARARMASSGTESWEAAVTGSDASRVRSAGSAAKRDCRLREASSVARVEASSAV